MRAFYILHGVLFLIDVRVCVARIHACVIFFCCFTASPCFDVYFLVRER